MSHKILVVEDNPITRKLLRVILQGDGYTVLEAPDGRTALGLAKAHDDIDLVLQDLLLPDMHGVELVQMLRKIPDYDSKPIIAVTGLVSKLEEAHSIKSGFTAYLSKPIERSRLLETVQTYLPKTEPQAEKPGRNRRVLLVNDDPIGLKLEKFHLERVGFQVNAVDNAERALDIAQSSPPHAIVTDLVMPGVNGLELAMLVRNHPRLRNIPVIVNSATYSVIEKQDLRAAKDMGADDFVLRTPDLDHVIAALLKALKKKQKSRPARNAAALLLKFNRRLIHQLEIQAAQRALELRRCALETAKLSVLTGVAEMLNQQLGVDSVLEEALARTLDASAPKILGHAGEQLAMINDIMQTTQLESRAAVAENLPVNVGDLMDQLRSDFALQTGKEAMRLVWSYPDGAMVITTDGAKLKQILRNLVGNALKFTDEGTVTVSARAVSPSSDSCFVEFTVADTGNGVPAEKLGTIFEQFYQVDSSATRLYGGVGIGLYICKQFTELLRGRIDVESEVGKGSIFVVKIPRQSQAEKNPGQDAGYSNSQELS